MQSEAVIKCLLMAQKLRKANAACVSTINRNPSAGAVEVALSVSMIGSNTIARSVGGLIYVRITK